MRSKTRLSASVDAGYLAAGRRAVAAGLADNLSSWVSEALRRQVEHDARMEAFDRFILAYEAEYGEITGREIDDAARRARSRAIPVRGLDSTGNQCHRRVAEKAE